MTRRFLTSLLLLASLLHAGISPLALAHQPVAPPSQPNFKGLPVASSIAPQAPLSGAEVGRTEGFIVYAENGEITCRDASLNEAREINRRDRKLELTPIARPERFLSSRTGKDSGASLSTDAGGTPLPAVNGLTIVLRATARLQAPENQPVRDAFVRAAAVWEAMITSPLTVVIDVDYGTTTITGGAFGTGVLGVGGGGMLQNVYPTVRQRLIEGASSGEEAALYNNLPAGAVPTNLGATTNMWLVTPVMRALGLCGADATTDTSNCANATPPRASFNSTQPFDFNPDNGIDQGTFDFVTVATHEIGHALGFGSRVGETPDPEGVQLTVWDLYRFGQGGMSLATFSSAPRMLSAGGEHVHFDGSAEARLSTGNRNGQNGDGRQASHWKDDELTGAYIGIMDPTIPSGGSKFVTDHDRRAIDRFGYRVNAGATPNNTTVQFEFPNTTINETDSSLQAVVTRSGDTNVASSVNYFTTDSSATDRSDYTAALGTIHFASGETRQEFKVFITNDRSVEANEVFSLHLTSPSGATIGAQSSQTVTIINDDTANGANPVRPDSFDPQFFVRQHYIDFLNREPDPAGLSYWSGQTTDCGHADLQVCRDNVSAAFFVSIEFQQTGYLVYLFNQAAYGRRIQNTVPVTLREFLPDTQAIGRGVIIGQAGADAVLEQNKQAFALSFVSRPEFIAQYPTTLAPEAFVDALNANTGGSLSGPERDQRINELTANNTTAGRASVLRRVAEDADFSRLEFNRAFVLMQYFGYLRRNPFDAPESTLDFTGYNFWLGKLNSFGGNYIQAQMVQAFIISEEYFRRFGP